MAEALGYRETIGRPAASGVAMNQRKGRKRRMQDALSSDLRMIVHDAAKTRALRPETRYAFVILANIFHEVMLLQRLIARSEPPTGALDHIGAAQIAQSMALVRMLGGKLWEARLRMNDAVLSKELREEFWPAVDDSADNWKKLSRAISGAKWLDHMRNAHAFHYPSYQQIGAQLEAHWPASGATVFGDTHGNTLFYEADQALLLAFFATSTTNSTGETHFAAANDTRAVVRAFEPILGELYDLSSALTQLLATVLAAFVFERLHDGQTPTPLGEIEGPRWADFFLPYFLKV